jgi:tetratricopeptide (TPR) repeat protein
VPRDVRLEINPKLFDMVSFETSRGGATRAVRTGTLVELLGTDSGLVEISDESGVATEFLSIPLRDMKVVWSSTRSPVGEHENGEHYFQEALLLLQNGILPLAKDTFRKAFAIQPNLAGTLTNLTNDLASKRSFDSALMLYQIVMELQPNYKLARENLARTYLNRGVEYANRGALDKALEDFTKALSFEGSEEIIRLSRHNLAAALTQVGLHHVQIKRFVEAFQFFLGALQLEPFDLTRRNFALALVSLAAWKEETRSHSIQEELFKEPLLMGLTYSECLNAYGATVATLGKIAEAIDIIEKALSADPYNELAKRNLSILSNRSVSEVFPLEMWGLTAVQPQSAGLQTR